MQGSRIFGLVVIVTGLLVALVPNVILPVCEELVKTAMGTSIPMRCHYTATAEIGVGFLLAVAGALFFVYGGPFKINGVLSAMILALGVVTILIPTVLIGTCAAPDHPCNVGSKPALILLGAFTLLLGAGGVWQSWRASKSVTPPAA